ncbi:MAG: preprotein translocase subunit SecG [Firmicutes bacterium]|nr:preprotein translocase subunit SecG [Bacillota bacterium]
MVTAYDVVNGFSIAFMVLMVLFSIAMIIIVALQEGGNANLGAVSGSSESFFGRNRAKTMDAKFKRWTMIVGAGILISSIAHFALYLVRENL